MVVHDISKCKHSQIAADSIKKAFKHSEDKNCRFHFILLEMREWGH